MPPTVEYGRPRQLVGYDVLTRAPGGKVSVEFFPAGAEDRARAYLAHKRARHEVLMDTVFIWREL